MVVWSDLRARTCLWEIGAVARVLEWFTKFHQVKDFVDSDGRQKVWAASR